MNARDVALVICAGWLALLLARDEFDGKPDREVAEMMTDSLISELRGRGWEVRTAEEVRGLEVMILDLVDDTTRMSQRIREYAAEVRLSGAETRALTELVATARAEIESHGQIHGDTIMVPQLLPDSVTYTVTDEEYGTFGGRLAIQPRLPGWPLSGELVAMVRGAVTITEGADGRMIFGAIAADPRVRLALESAYYDPPPPVIRCSIGQRAMSAAVGSLLTLGGIAVYALH